nr:lipase family protein [Micromonospora sp. DSM 115978]
IPHSTVDPLTTPQWQARLAENLLGSDPPDVPLYLYHGTIDTTVAFGQGEALMRTYCQAGADVTWVTFPGDHGSGIGQQAGALEFLGNQFAGRPSQPTC